MNKYFQKIKTYVTTSPGKEIAVGVAIILSFACLIIAIVSLIMASGPKIAYQPAVACNLLTKDEAREMLGQNVLGGDRKNPTLTNDVATSKCAYTDMNPEQSAMRAAAVAVQSAVTDKGAERVKATFAASKIGKNTEEIKDVGDSAYFDPKLGQLNVLDGRNWIIVSYGVGESPQSNTVDDAVELAQKLLSDPRLPTF